MVFGMVLVLGMFEVVKLHVNVTHLIKREFAKHFINPGKMKRRFYCLISHSFEINLVFVGL